MNHVTIVGRISSEIQGKYTPQGTAVLEIVVLVQEQQKNGFISTPVPVVIWGSLAEEVARIVQKGTNILVIGKLVTRTWNTKQGERRESWSVNAQTIKILFDQSEPAVVPQGAGDGIRL